MFGGVVSPSVVPIFGCQIYLRVLNLRYAGSSLPFFPEGTDCCSLKIDTSSPSLRCLGVSFSFLHHLSMASVCVGAFHMNRFARLCCFLAATDASLSRRASEVLSLWHQLSYVVSVDSCNMKRCHRALPFQGCVVLLLTLSNLCRN